MFCFCSIFFALYSKNSPIVCLLHEFEKWCAICASVGGVGGVLAWVVWAECLRGWRASVGSVGGVVACLRWWRASVGGVGSVLTWAACYYYCYYCY